MSRFDMSPEAQKVYDHLLTVPKEFTYKEMQNLTGVNELARLRGYIMTAIRRMRKQKVWYDSVRGVGYRLLDEDGKNPVQSEGLKRIRTRVKRLHKNQDLISFELLTPEGKLHFTLNAGLIGAQMVATGRKTANEIKRKMANGDLPLPKKKD